MEGDEKGDGGADRRIILNESREWIKLTLVRVQ
jgi:hypothetical protein